MLERLRSFFTSNSTIRRTHDFLNSQIYPAVVALLVFIGYISGIEVWTVSLIVFVTAYGLLVSEDLRPLIPPLLIVPFSFTLEHSPGRPNFSDYYTQTWIYVLGAILCVVLLAGIVWHYILWGGARRTFLSPTRLSSYHVVLALGLLLNGITSVGYWVRADGKTGYWVGDITNALVMIGGWIVLYMIFVRGIKYSREAVEHFCATCQWMAILLIAQLVFICVTNEVIQDGTFHKDNIVFGWGINNNFGGILVYLLPPVFYLAAHRPRTGWVQLFVSVLMMVAIFFSMSRSALLVGALIYIACLVVVCFVGQNKILFRAFSCGAIVTGAFTLIFFRNELMEIFSYYAERGFSDSGRFDLWRDCLANFPEHPLLGAGFHATPFSPWSGREFGYAHNTIIQLISAGGLLTTLAYLATRAKSIWMIVYKMNTERLFLGLGLAALLGVSLLDNHMFNVYPTFFYAIVLAFIENDFDLVARPMTSPLLRVVAKRKEKKKSSSAENASEDA